MTRKIVIRRGPGGWHVVRPPFGFAGPTTTVYSTGAAALASLTRQGLGGVGNVTDRGSYTLFSWARTGQVARRPRWFTCDESGQP